MGKVNGIIFLMIVVPESPIQIIFDDSESNDRLKGCRKILKINKN